MASGQFANPGFMARNEIDFHGQLNGEAGMIAASLLDLFNVFIEICLQHMPIIPIIPEHRIVFGKPDFGEAKLQRASSEFSGLSGGMPAQRSVHVIIRR